ncbi:hypothetical protein P5673_020874, partial [Acropora cervicornis]
MAESSNKHLSHKCSAAALCSVRSDNRKDLIFHAFSKDQILRKTWEINMKRGDKKFASNRALYCCSEHFVETDYKRSLTDQNDEVSQRSVRARIRGDKTTKSFAGPLDKETESASDTDDDIFFYTGFQSYNALIAFWNFVKPCSESLLSWNRARAKTKEKQRKREIQPIDQLWMFLTKVRLGLFERDLAHIFDVSVSTVSDLVVTWANYLIMLLGSLPVWPSKEKIKEHLPDSFKGKYENVRGILDCTELKCELPKDYQKHSEMYSHDTFKGLVCISPSGWITFEESVEKIVEKSNFYQLIEAGDQYLADKGFEIHDLIALRGGSLFIPPK